MIALPIVVGYDFALGIGDITCPICVTEKIG